MKRFLPQVVFGVLSVFAAFVANAQTTAAWNFGSGSLAPSTAPTGATGSNFSVTGATASATAGVYRTTNWPLSPSSIDVGKYYEVTLTPTGGNRIDFTSIDFTLARDGNGPTNWALRSSVDSYAGNVATGSLSGSNNNVDLSSISNQTAAVTFRIYAWDATTAGGQGNLDNVTITAKIYNATEPSTQASALDVYATAVSTEVTLRWSDGDGSSNIVIGNIGGPVSFTPTDGTSLAGSPSLDITAGGSDQGGNNHLLAVTADGTAGITITNLVVGTRYGFRVYERNSTGSQANYNTSSATNNPITSVQRAPSSDIFTTSLTGTQLTLDWTNGGGNTGRILVAKAGGPVDQFPVDGTPYTADNNFGAAPELVVAGGNKVVASGSGPATITGLTAGVTYHFRAFEVNTSDNYTLSQAITRNPVAVISSVPGTQALDVIATGTGTAGEMKLNWTNGNGTGGRIVLMKQTSTFISSDYPVNGTTYAGNQAYGSAPTIGAARVVYTEASGGTGGSTGITITGLGNNNTYFIKVLEYNGAAGAESYNLADGASANPVSRTTPVTSGPTTSASQILFTGGTTASLSFGWTAGNGTGGRIIVAKPTSAIISADQPLDGVSYTGNNDFTLAPTIGPNGARVVYNDAVSGASQLQGPITISGLSAGTVYHFQVFDFIGGAGTGAENYRLNTGTNNPNSRSTVVSTAPSVQALDVTANGTGTAGQLLIKWTNGDGDGGRIVVVKPNSAFVVGDDPVNGSSFNDNLNFSSAPTVGSNGAKVVYVENAGGSGGTSGITVTNLGNNALYYIKVYEFDGTMDSGAEAYMTADGASNNPINRRTYHGTEPPTDASNIVFGTIGSTAIQLSWTNGSYTGLTVTGASGDGSTATLTFAAQTSPPFPVGSVIRVAAVNPAGYNTPTTGAVVTACNLTSVSYSNTTVAAYVSGGNIQTGGRVLLVKPTSDLSAGDRPVDGNSYTYSGLDYGSGNAIGGSGSRVVYSEDYSGTGSTGVIVTGLTPATSYRFFVVEFSGARGTGAENYNNTGGTNNVNTGQIQATIAGAPPTNQALDIVFTTTTLATTLQFGWTNGNGADGRIAIIKAGAITGADNPVNGITYTGNNDFAAAPTLGGAKVIYSDGIAGVGQATAPITVTNLAPNTTYFVKVFEFNGGPGFENYQTADGTSNNPRSSTTHIQPVVTYGVTSGTTGNAAITSDFTVSFNIPVRFVGGSAISTDAEIKQFVHLLDNTTLAAIPFTASINAGKDLITITPANSNIPGNKLTGSRDYIVSIDASEIETNQGVILPTSNQVIVATTLAEPTNQPTLPTTASTITSITLGWTDAIGAQLPENYLVVGIENGGSFPAVVDLTDPAVDLDFSDGTIIAKVPHGTAPPQLLLTTGVKSGQPYDFRIYSYTNEASLIDFKTTGFLTPTVSTATGSESIVQNGSGSGTVSSATNDLTAADAAGANFTFEVNDDGAPLNDGVDNAPTRVTGVVINRDITDQTGDWTTVIAGLVLTDGPNSYNSSANPLNFDIQPDKIVITAIPAALGLVADNTTKTFQVKLWLRTDTAPLNIDGLDFGFTLSDTDITVATVNSSNMNGAGTASAVADIAVTATHLAYLQQPTTTSRNVAMTPAVTVVATDINGNRDFGFVSNITITSSGTLLGSPVIVAAISGIATFSTLTHTATGSALTLSAAAGLPGGPATSNAFNITGSDIIVKAGYLYPQNINYAAYQDAVITNGGGSIETAIFTLRDGFVNGPDTDLFGTTLTSITLGITNPGFIRSIAIFDATDTKVGEQPGGASVSFPALSITAPDNGQVDFKIRVSFTTAVTDNQSIAFTVTSVSGTGSTFSTSSAGGAATSIAPDNNKIEVTATNLQFTTAPTTSIFAGVPFPAPIALAARDGNNNLDLDYAATVTVSNAGSIPMTDAAGHNSVPNFTVPFVAGVLTLDAQLRYDHRGAGNGTLTIANLPAGLSITSAGIAVNVSSTSDIVENSLFAYSSNIDYKLFNSSDINPVATPGDELAVAEFYLRDGGSVLNDADGVATELTNLTFNIANASLISRLALYNGTTELGEVAVVGTTASFGPFSLIAPDDNKTTQLRLYATFNTVITDNQQIQFTVNTATVNSIRSLLPTGTTGNAGGAFSSLSGDRNRMEVVAADLDYTSISLAGVNVFIGANFNVIVEARDINNNLDLDFVETVTSITNAGTLVTTPSPATSGAFVAGIKNFTFKYETPGNGTLTMSTASIANEVSPPITVTASATSTVFLSGSYNVRIDYINHQQASNPNSFILATFTLNDGAPGDSDFSPTVLDQIQFTLTNPTFVKRIGVYNSGGTLIGSDQAGSGSHTFSALNISAPDDGSTTFTIRASFESTTVIDEQNIQLVLTGATAGVGSNFLVGAGLVGGSILTNRTTPSTGVNITDVVATQLVYMQQPPAIAGTQQPVPVTGTQVRLEARDINNRLDTEFDASSTVSFSAPAGVAAFAHPFLNGVADINRDNLRYLQEGIGTLTATANNPPPTVVAVANAVSNLVDVYEVRAQLSMGSVSTPQNLAGGSVNKVIYGVTFRTNHTTAGQPKLRSFKISFLTTGDLDQVLQNARVFEQINQVNFVGGTNITTFGGSVTIDPGAAHTVSVDLTAQPRDFSLSAGRTYTYFLMVDINPQANSLTPTIEPYVEDLNWNNSLPGFDPTNNNIVISPLNGVNQGGGRASLGATRLGYDYSFAAIFPPKLVNSNPTKGAINVNPAGNIVLTFDVPVFSLDGIVKLYRNTSVGSPGTFLTNLPIVGAPGSSAPNASSTITFGPLPGIGPLNYGDLLYITIAPVDQAQTTGIRDQTGNKFAGISSPGTVYFRVASNQPPLLLTGPTPAVPLTTDIVNVSLQGATIQATFDKPGTAYWVLTNTAAPRPSRAEILGLGNNAAGITGVAYASALTRGSFDISQIQPAGVYGQINYGLSNGVSYKVWMFAANSDLPANVPTVGAYSDTFTAIADGSPAPSTFTFTASNPPGAGIIVQAPDITICTGNTQRIINPIRIVERANNDLLAGGAGLQTFNLVLPPGYIFDISQPGTVSLSATTDFTSTTGSTLFLSSSIVQIRYDNAGTSASLDNITITDLYITATGTGTGEIVKLGGTLTAISDLTVPLAQLTTTTATPAGLSFDNSSTGPVTFLPNKITTPVGHPQFAVQLRPTLPAGDFGPSVFSGDGVTVDSLHVNAVTVSQPFIITMTHTDFNGCVSTAELQYLVYDHRTGLGISSQYCISPQYFPNPAGQQTVFNVLYDAFPGFYLTNLFTSPVPGGYLGGLGMSPPVTTLPVQLLPGFNPANNPKPGPPPTLYYNFEFDVTDIENGTAWYTESSYVRGTGNGNRFYTGGSLGSVEFRGLYQSIANTALFDVPLQQNTEMFAPPLPYIEVSGNLQNMPGATTFNPAGSGNLPPMHPTVGMSGHPGTYLFCENSGIITFEAYPRASSVASGTFALYDYSVPATPVLITPDPAFIDQNNGTATLNPAAFTASQPPAKRYKEILVTYTYKEANSPCQSVARMVIQITPNPVPAFSYSTTCEDIPVDFTDLTTIAGTGFTVAEWSWNFGDVNSGALNSSNLQNPSHIYATPQGYSGISLDVKSGYGCPSITPATASFNVGGTPIVNYTFSGVSTADTFSFRAVGSSTPNDSFATLRWVFEPGDTVPVSYANQADFTTLSSPTTYTTPGYYVTDLEVISTLGCRALFSDQQPNTVGRTLVVVPKKTATNLAAYEVDFEANDGGWLPWYASTPGNPIVFDPNPTLATPPPSWIHNGPDRNLIKRDPAITGTAFWGTDSLALSGKHNPKERSALYSPSFDLSGLLAPMLSFNAFVDLGPSDGLIVEYSQDNKNIADPTKVWTVLGINIGEGVDWFTDRGIAAKPGAQLGNDFGWTGTGTKWIEPKHTLDTIQTTGSNTNVVLRFSLASLTGWSPTFDKEGLAIDNVRIGDRTRTILLESFANVGNSNTLEKAMNDSIRDFPRSIVGTKVVKINYHVNFPLDDPFNLDNPTDPSSRASFYGVTTTPKSRLDGSNDPLDLDRPFISWGYGLYGKRSLQLAQADMTIIPTVTTGDISITIDVDAKFDLPANTVLNVAVVENLVNIAALPAGKQPLVKSGETDFNYVLKKLLPSASGTKFGTMLSKGNSRSFGPFTYTRGNLYDNPDDLRIIAFLQQEDGLHEIYQVSDTTGFADPGTVTGLEPLAAERVLVYPNPANSNVTVQLPGVLSKPASLQLIDQTGRSVLRSTMPEGSDRKTLGVSDLTGGMYILTIDMGQGVLTRKKVMIVHQD